MAIQKFQEARDCFWKLQTSSGADRETRMLAKGLHALAQALHTEIANLQIQTEELQHRISRR